MVQTLGILLASIMLGLSMSMDPAAAQKKYDPGATDSEIKIGNIMPYSGPLSAYKLVGRTQDAFFKKLNAEGGINGRKINFISYDDQVSAQTGLSYQALAAATSGNSISSVYGYLTHLQQRDLLNS